MLRAMYVFVFESLKKENIKTGKKISEALDEEKIPSQFTSFHSQEELFKLLDNVAEKIYDEGLFPFIHLDCHGNNEGIFALNEKDEQELIPWRSLMVKLIQIYKASDKSSVVCISSCEGITATSMIATASPCPYYYIAGSLKKIPPRKTLEAFKQFYFDIWEGNDIWDTAVKINHMHIFREIEFMAINRDTSWNLLKQGYLKDISNPTFLAQRKVSLEKEYAKLMNEINDEQKAFLEKAYTEEWQRRKLMEYKEIFYS